MVRQFIYDNWKALAVTIVFLFVVANVVSFIWFPFLPWFEERQAGQNIIENTYDAEQAEQDYREFRRLYNTIEQYRQQLDNVRTQEAQFHETWGNDSATWPRDVRTRHGRIHDRLLGNKNQLEDVIAQYNTQADDATTQVFQCQLPYQVDERLDIYGPPGSGSAEEPVDVTRDGQELRGGANVPPAEQCDGLPEQATSQPNQ